MQLTDYYMTQLRQLFQQFVGDQPNQVKCLYIDLIETVMAASRSDEGFGYPLLHLEYPRIRFEERSEMLTVIFDCVGVILVRADEDTAAAKQAAIQASRHIWDHIFYQLRKEAIYKDDYMVEFTLNNVTGEVVLPTFTDRTYGYEYRFNILFHANIQSCD